MKKTAEKRHPVYESAKKQKQKQGLLASGFKNPKNPKPDCPR